MKNWNEEIAKLRKEQIAEWDMQFVAAVLGKKKEEVHV